MEDSDVDSESFVSCQSNPCSSILTYKSTSPGPDRFGDESTSLESMLPTYSDDKSIGGVSSSESERETCDPPDIFTPASQEEEPSVPLLQEEMGSLSQSYQTLSQEGGSSHAQDLTGEDVTLYGYLSVKIRIIIYIVLNLCTLGLPALVCRWFPQLKVKLTCSQCLLSVADWIVLTVNKDDVVSHDICRVHKEPAGQLLPAEFQTQVKSPRLKHQNSKTHLVATAGSVYRYFIYRHHKYVWDDKNECFRKLSGLDNIKCRKMVENVKGISSLRRDQLLTVYGRNWIEVEVKGYLKLLVDEVLNPFYIFQIFSVLLWSLDEYVYYASCVVVISAISIAIALFETRRQAKMLRSMAQSSDSGNVVIRTPDGEEQTTSSRELVPGDVIVVPPEGFVMPCDAVLVNGTCIVNESMLTGESTPVQKSALMPTDEKYDLDTHRRHTLFAGTQVIQTRYYMGNKVTCVVVRTGYSTVKGDLIHSILYPKEIGFKFYTDAMRFVVMLFCLAALGMAYCVYVYMQRGSSLTTTILRVLDIVTIVVPPALPAAMTVGTVYAQSRLKKKLIYCISPPRINFCGKLKLVCFDKTGTLTEDGLDMWCVVPVGWNTDSSAIPEFQEPVADPAQLGLDDPLLRALASCHSLTYIHGKLVGDPLDIKMFLSTGCSLEEPVNGIDDIVKYDLLSPTVVRKNTLEMGIIREFEFTPQLQRMSVVVRTLDNPDMMLYSKGAPEKIRSLCIPSTIPESFGKVLDSFTVKGYRVLALGQRKIENAKWHQVQRLERTTVEKDLHFCGFIVMQNSLKPATIPVIEELNHASVRSVMVTGDNMLTALSVARECGIVPSCDKVLIVNVNEEDNSLEFELAAHYYEDVRESSLPISTTGNNCSSSAIGKDVSVTIPSTTIGNTYPYTSSRRMSTNSDIEVGIHLEHLIPISETVVNLSRSLLQLQDCNYHFVMTGRTWSLLDEVASPATIDRLVAKGAVYARMSPENKSQLVERLQSLGYLVGMCGDGANDCQALKQAHVGISLSEAEASVAAPFTSKVSDISCVPNLIREGRCALVTSFAIFKYMALYSFVQFVSVLLLYHHKTNLADTQFLYIDLGITTSIAIVMGRTEPYPKLVPQRPMGSLVSFQNIFSIVVQVLISALIQTSALMFLESQTWFVPLSLKSPDELITLCWETTTIFSVSGFQYLILALVFSKGPPFRKPFYTDGIFVLVYLGLVAATLFLAVAPPKFLESFFHLMPQTSETSSFRIQLLILPVINLVVAFMLEKPWAAALAKSLSRKFCKKGPKNPYKSILKELEEDLAWPAVKA